jgi:hypothetical protein
MEFDIIVSVQRLPRQPCETCKMDSIEPFSDFGRLPKVLGGNDTPEGRKKVLGTIPLGRVCTPE